MNVGRTVRMLAVIAAVGLAAATPRRAHAAALPPPPPPGDTTVVPEPATALLSAAGVMLALTHRPRRTRVAAQS